MKSTSENLSTYTEGKVSGKWVSETGDVIPVDMRHNQMSFLAATALASAYAGSLSMVPVKIGFVYGSSASPAEISPASSRNQTWDLLSEEMAAIHGNIELSEFNAPPSISSENIGESSVLSNNVVTFHANTRSGSSGTYAFPTTGGTYAGPFGDGMYIYHAILFGNDPHAGCNETRYIPLARVTLAGSSGSYKQKPSNYELALDWKVSFY